MILLDRVESSSKVLYEGRRTDKHMLEIIALIFLNVDVTLPNKMLGGANKMLGGVQHQTIYLFLIIRQQRFLPVFRYPHTLELYLWGHKPLGP